LRIILTLTEKSLIGVNAEKGDLLFRYPRETRHGANVTSPLFHKGCIFVTSGYGGGSEKLRLTVANGKASVEHVWRSDDLDNLHGGVILADGCLYGAAHQAKRARCAPWVCLDWETGKTRRVARGIGAGSATWADGMLYVLNEKGQVALVRCTPQKHEVVSRFCLPREERGATWAHPVVCGGRLYVRHGDRLYCHRVRGEESSQTKKRGI
jgi:hypothetical protein